MFKNLRFRTKLLILFTVAALPSLIISILSLYSIHRLIIPLTTDLPQGIATVSRTSQLDALAQLIRYYDEVLTQSARNFAFTQDPQWMNRYNETVPKLDEAIGEAIRAGDEEDKGLFSSIDEANRALVRMEEESMGLVNAGNPQQAIAILESTAYEDQKNVYGKVIMTYVQRRGEAYGSALTASTGAVDTAAREARLMLVMMRNLLIVASFVSIALALFLALMLSYIIARPLRELEFASREVAKGNTTHRISVRSNDEIGMLGTSFNAMINRLQETNATIEKKILERTTALNTLNKFMTGRELKMVELKKRIRELEEQVRQTDRSQSMTS